MADWACATISASACLPFVAAHSSLASTSAPAPSLTPGEFPAVCEPSLETSPGSLASVSRVEPRRETSLEVLAKLPPLNPDGSHTAGNSPGVNDGAGAVVVASDEWASAHDAKPLARIIAHAQVADEYPYLARTPAAASKKALEKAGLSADDIDLWEINEAFASVTLNSIRVLGIDEEKVNVNGGAVAIGHPIGASGARILGALVQELHRRGGGKGVVAICSGGGQGDAVVLEVFGNGS